MPTATALCALLLDVSGSMAYPVGNRQRIEVAADVLRLSLNRTPGARVVLFNTYAYELVGLDPSARSLKLPEAEGGTALHLGLDLIGTMTPKPMRIVLISDGLPDDAEAALRSARALAPCEISAFHVGDDGDRIAAGFLKELALAGGLPGKSGVRSLTDPATLADEIGGLLAGPSR